MGNKDIVQQSTKTKNSNNRRDCVYTPEDLAVKLIKKIKINKNDILLDPAAGTGVFWRNFPKSHRQYKCEIENGSNFFEFKDKVDWIITNPPYSILNKYLEHSFKLANKGIAFLVGSYSLTPKRLEMIENAGFKIVELHYLKVSAWYGIQCFMILERKEWRAISTKITYTRKVFQCSNHIKKSVHQKTLID